MARGWAKRAGFLVIKLLTKDIYRLIILVLSLSLSGERKKRSRLRVPDWLTITILPTLMQRC